MYGFSVFATWLPFYPAQVPIYIKVILVQVTNSQNARLQSSIGTTLLDLRAAGATLLSVTMNHFFIFIQKQLCRYQ